MAGHAWQNGFSLALALGLAAGACTRSAPPDGTGGRTLDGAWAPPASGTVVTAAPGADSPLLVPEAAGAAGGAAPDDDLGAAGRGGFAPEPSADGAGVLTRVPDGAASASNDPAAADSAAPSEPASDAVAVEAGACAFPTELLDVPEAGTGAISGCPPRECEGLSGADRDRYDVLEVNPQTYAGCTTVRGDLVVQNAPVFDLSALACLEHVTGDFVIWGNDLLVSLHGLESLTKVDGTFGIGDYRSLSMGNEAITSLEPLGNVRAVGELKLSSNYALRSLKGFASLRAIAGSLWISFARDVTSLEGFEALRAVGGRVDLWRPEGIDDVTGFDGLEVIGDGLLLWGATDLVDFDGFNTVRCIGGDVDVGGTAGWEENAVLQRFGGLAALEVVHGGILLHHNAQLRVLDAFGALTTLGGDLAVHDNPVLPQCSVDALAERLREAGYSGITQLDGNGPC